MSETNSPKKTIQDQAKEKTKEYNKKLGQCLSYLEETEYGKKSKEKMVEIYNKNSYFAAFLNKEFICTTNIEDLVFAVTPALPNPLTNC